jgi:hypothetical protein
MQQTPWNIRARQAVCAVSGRPFDEGERHFTAIYFDTENGGFLRRDVCLESWPQELEERTPVAQWRSTFEKNQPEVRPEVVDKASAMELLQRLSAENEPHTENARYVLAILLERRKQLHPTVTKEDDQGRKMLFYENRKTGEIFLIMDPELKLSELEPLQDEVASLLGFAGPAADAAKAVGMAFTPTGELTPAQS